MVEEAEEEKGWRDLIWKQEISNNASKLCERSSTQVKFALSMGVGYRVVLALLSVQQFHLSFIFSLLAILSEEGNSVTWYLRSRIT